MANNSLISKRDGKRMRLYSPIIPSQKNEHNACYHKTSANRNVFFSKMDEILEHPTYDPHGSPIPDSDGNIPGKEYRHKFYWL